MVSSCFADMAVVYPQACRAGLSSLDSHVVRGNQHACRCASLAFAPHPAAACVPVSVPVDLEGSGPLNKMKMLQRMRMLEEKGGPFANKPIKDLQVFGEGGTLEGRGGSLCVFERGGVGGGEWAVHVKGRG
jgi:hypothetical protein